VAIHQRRDDKVRSAFRPTNSGYRKLREPERKLELEERDSRKSRSWGRTTTGTMGIDSERTLAFLLLLRGSVDGGALWNGGRLRSRRRSPTADSCRSDRLKAKGAVVRVLCTKRHVSGLWYILPSYMIASTYSAQVGRDRSHNVCLLEETSLNAGLKSKMSSARRASTQKWTYSPASLIFVAPAPVNSPHFRRQMHVKH